MKRQVIRPLLWFTFTLVTVAACGGVPSPDVEATAPAALTDTPTAQPTATSTPEPTDTPTPEPTDTPISAVTNTPIPTSEAAPFQFEPYIHPSRAFSFVKPAGLVAQQQDSAVYIEQPESFALIGLYGPDDSGAADIQTYLVEQYTEGAGITAYEVIVQETQSDGSLYTAITYTTPDTDSEFRADFLVKKQGSFLFALLFIAPTAQYDELRPVWEQIMASFAVNPEAVGQ
jgi:hypothetical protein